MVSALARRSLIGAVGLAPTLRPLPLVARRWATTQTITEQENIALLNAQRLRRPNSPHFTIYQPQVTWLLSIANRVTGSFLSGALYLGAVTYLLHPMYPAIDSAHLIDLVTSLPTWAKGSAKLIFAVPFTFHTFNGIRHLAWDIGYGLTLKGMQAGAYITMAATAVSSIYLAFFV
ncbi:hypothetical protein DB88DRAFT_489711 [Papiliotrema laurentii]|uniref:Uncharacterized protein n=1 Tax=Papiliotrema laurentii TaxID=5418 RepID=A0AAD9CZ40_PAPLA|nr:hypothetical protein DB88DRAFT_489711 [Papiliotrema laurentii]